MFLNHVLEEPGLKIACRLITVVHLDWPCLRETINKIATESNFHSSPSTLVLSHAGHCPLGSPQLYPPLTVPTFTQLSFRCPPLPVATFSCTTAPLPPFQGYCPGLVQWEDSQAGTDS